MSKPGDLYDEDFVRWTEDQAAALRRAKATGANLSLDWDHLAEEIESLGRSDRRKLRSQIRLILRYLFDLVVSPADESRTRWRVAIIEARAEIKALLEDSPSLRNEVEALIAKLSPLAAELAAGDLEACSEPTERIGARLVAGGFTAEEVLEDWFPPLAG
jgi:hypothetical protein